MRQIFVTSQVLMRMRLSVPPPSEKLSHSLELTPATRYPTVHIAVIWPLLFQCHTFLVRETKTLAAGTFGYSSFYFYVSNKLSESKSGSLYLYQLNRSGSGLGLSLPCHVCLTKGCTQLSHRFHQSFRSRGLPRACQKRRQGNPWQ